MGSEHKAGLLSRIATVPSFEDLERYKDTQFYTRCEDKKHEPEERYKLQIVRGRSNPDLGMDICKILRLDEMYLSITQRDNQEISINKGHGISAQGDDVYVVQPTAASAHGLDLDTSVMELLFIVHHLRLSGAKRITAIMPYFAYSRQNRKTEPRVPIAASAVAMLLQSMGVDRVLTVDLHCSQIQGFFHNCPVDNLPMHLEFARVVTERICKAEKTDASRDVVIIAPDANGVERARELANAVNALSVATILRRQTEFQESEEKYTGKKKPEVVGDVNDKIAVIIDDIVDTARTLAAAANLCKSKGARAVYACVTHGLLAKNAVDILNGCANLKELIVTDSVALGDKPRRCPKIHVISIAPMLAEAIERTHSEVSLTAMFRPSDK